MGMGLANISWVYPLDFTSARRQTLARIASISKFFSSSIEEMANRFPISGSLVYRKIIAKTQIRGTSPCTLLENNMVSKYLVPGHRIAPLQAG
jgi:hypothetical protein